ncbi:MAG TPA: O-antigen ligase family protein [Candidatus Paceibacterota bacterium]|nr:O-antigen ligase family protein [Candidatus Paceibacterota bacterium]
MKTTVAGTLAAIAVALLPFITSNQIFYGPVNAKFFFVLFVIDLLALIAAHQFYKRKEGIKAHGRWLLFALIFATVVQVLATLTGVFPERSLWSDIFWSSGVLFLIHLAFLAFFLAELLNEQDWSLIRRAVAVSAGVFSALLIIGAQGFGATGPFLWLNLSENGLTFGNETYAGAYLLLAFGLGTIELLRTREWGRGRIVLLVSVILIALSPLMSNLPAIASIAERPAALLGLARASSAAMFFILLFLAGYFLIRKLAPKKAGRLVLAWGAVLVLGAATGIGLLFTPGSAVQQAYIEESTAARIIVWDASMNAIAERPILGWGPENFNYAIERHFDTRLFQDENLAEIWFERAHNVFIDTLVGAGALGLISFAILLLLSLVVIRRAHRKGLIGDAEAALLAALLFAHVLQLQTGFDTIGSYTLLAIVLGYLLWLERGLLPAAGTPSRIVRKGTVAVLVVLAAGSLIFCVLNEYTRQAALPDTFSARTLAAQAENREKSLERLSSFESLRLSSASFIKGSLAVIAERSTEERRASILAVAHAYEERYQEYLAEQPDHYRAQMNYAYLLLVMTTLGEDRVDDAKRAIERGYELSPGHPLTFVLDALAELYRGDLAESRRLLDEAAAINPDSEFTEEARTYFEEQYALFPNITVMKLTNL